MRARRLTGILAATAALCIGLGVPLMVHAGFTFNATLHKTHTGSFTVGGNGTYTIDLSMSSGSVAGDTFSVTDTLPNGLSYVTASGSSFSCSNSGQVVTCSGAPSMSQGATQDMTVVVGVGSAASPAVTNTASFRDTGNGDQVSSDNTAVDTASVAAASTSTSTSSATTSTSTGAPAAVAAPSVGAGSGLSLGIGLLGAGLLALVAAVVVRRRR